MKKSKKNFIIGLTGGIGSGKTAVCDILFRLNAYIIDADIIAREANGEIENAIKTHFAQFVLNGKLNRAALKTAAFNDDDIRKRLNSLTHPLIFNRINSQIKQGINIVAVPLLFESGFNKFCDYILGISAKKEDKIARVAARDSLNEDEICRIMNAQIDQNEMEKRCDYVIFNDGSLASLNQRVEEWWKGINEDYG